MEDKKQNEELQSRREFFKEAAKKALPVIGTIVLASSPIFANAAEVDNYSCSGCNNRCMNFCTNTCHGTCKAHCADNCNGNCRGTCSSTCGRSSR